MRLQFQHGNAAGSVDIEGAGDTWRVTLPDGSVRRLRAIRTLDGRMEIREASSGGVERVYRIPFSTNERGTALSRDGVSWTLDSQSLDRKKPAKKSSGSLTAPMVGIVAEVAVEEGQSVQQYQPIAVVEAMKVMATIDAPFAGTVARLYVKAGDTVAHGGPIADIVPPEGAGDLIAPLLKRVTKHARIVEVGPRDGLQNEHAILATEDKAKLVDLLAAAGLRDIEVTSFVSPKRVPQLADADDLFSHITKKPGIRYSALVPNERGLARAAEADVKAVAFLTSASETFNKRNIGMTIDESLKTFRALMPIARRHEMHVRVYISTAFVCPFEGPIDPDALTPIICDLMNMEVDEVSIGDTIGHAIPDQVARLTEIIAPDLPFHRAAYHFHDTRGVAMANVLMALQYGISAFDSSVGGVGGCPFAPGAAGNLATEDLVVMLNGMGIQTGVDPDKIVTAAQFLQQALGHPLTGRYLKACDSAAREACG